MADFSSQFGGKIRPLRKKIGSLAISPFEVVFLPLKVPSGQIGSALEYYHWIGLEKDINRYMLLIV
jgi:hypothetical protein